MSTPAPSESKSSPGLAPNSSSSSSSSSSSTSTSASTSTLTPTSTVTGRTPLYGGSRKGAKQWQEDAYFHWESPNRAIIVGGVMDGHGGYNGFLASNTARDTALAYFQQHAIACESWDIATWQTELLSLFDRMHQTIRDKFMEENNNEQNKDKRYVDDRGIVRGSNGDPVHGGTTSSVVVSKREPDGGHTLITANVGDSTAILVPQKAKFEFLTVDHGPESPEEYARVAALDSADYPMKLLFVYDKTNVFRKYECPTVFTPEGIKDPNFVSNPWGNGLHPTNVRYEPAVYAVTPRNVAKDSTCIAMTRALGDFYAHQFGLTNIPSIGVHRLPGSVDDTYTVVVASDGIWDCWKYEDLLAFINDLLHKKSSSLEEMGETTLNESISRAIANFGAKHYDDACIVCWQLHNHHTHNNTNTTHHNNHDSSTSTSTASSQNPHRNPNTSPRARSQT